MEKIMQINIGYDCIDSKNKFNSIYATHYQALVFNKEEIINFIDGVIQYMDDNFGKYWKTPSMIDTISLTFIIPGITYDGKTFIQEPNTEIRWRYGTSYITGIYHSINKFKENLNEMEDIYNVYLNHWKNYKEEN